MPFYTRGGPPSKRGRMDGETGFGGGYGTGFGGEMSQQQVEQELLKVNNDIKPNNIVLLTILNAKYTINVQVIHKVCQNIGNILRIVVFSRGATVQSMVEFDTVKSATNAKNRLHGCDVYYDSCTLKVEYAKTDRLNVKRNEEMTWDYTEEFAVKNRMIAKDSFVDEEPRRVKRRDRTVLLYEPPHGSLGPGAVGRMPAIGPMGPMDDMDNGWGRDNIGMEEWSGAGKKEYIAGNFYQQGDGLGEGFFCGCVVMVYGLESEKFNCQRLFNLLCQYGNIIRIMFLRNKEGTAMVELDSPEAAYRVIENLNFTPIFGLKLKLDWSNKQFIDQDKVRNPHKLEDGSPSYGDFARDRNNRFMTPKRAAKNRIIAPSKILHFYNVPKIEDEELEFIFTSASAPAPTNIKWFPANSESSCLTGLCEFDSVQEACEALILANHTKIDGTSNKNPYNMKLCFSK